VVVSMLRIRVLSCFLWKQWPASTVEHEGGLLVTAVMFGNLLYSVLCLFDF
jgi:hypothetical protein